MPERGPLRLKKEQDNLHDSENPVIQRSRKRRYDYIFPYLCLLNILERQKKAFQTADIRDAGDGRKPA